MASRKLTACLLFAVALACTGTVFALDLTPVKSLELSTAQPPADLARGAEIILVSGYKPVDKTNGATVNVHINRPGSKVLLVLTSYEKVNWIVSAPNSTRIAGILVSGYYPPTVTTAHKTRAFMTKLPNASDTENVKFKEILVELNTLFGINQVDVFRGSHAIPQAINISALDPPRTKLSLEGPPPKAISHKFEFDLLTTDHSMARWTTAGPVSKERKGYFAEGKVAASGSGKTIFKLKNDHLEIVDAATAKTIAVEVPADFPRFSWAMDLAYDSKQEIVSIATLGGEGFFYRFDVKNRRWLDYRSLENVDIHSLSYDSKANCYVAWTSQGELLVLSDKGGPVHKVNLVAKLDGFGRLYDRGNARPPRLQIAPNGDDIALIYINGYSVSRIWHYDLKTGNATLTYAQIVPN